jgi:hypothetical protein
VQDTVADGQRPVRREHVNAAGIDGRPVFSLGHPQRRVSGEQVRHQALAGGVEVRDDDERQVAVGGHRVEKLSEGVQAAGGGTDVDHDGPRRERIITPCD